MLYIILTIGVIILSWVMFGTTQEQVPDIVKQVCLLIAMPTTGVILVEVFRIILRIPKNG